MTVVSLLQGAELSDNDVPTLDVRALGCRLLNETGGYDVSAGEDNADACTEYFQSGFRTQGRPMSIPYPGIGICKSIVTTSGAGKQVMGHAIYGHGGQCQSLAEIQHTSSGTDGIGGLTSRLVCTDASGLTSGAMLITDSYGIALHNLVLQGHYHPTSRTTLLAETAEFADIGILGTDIDNTGVGKLWFNTLSVCCCTTGIQCGLDATGQSFDQIYGGQLWTPDCGTGIKLMNVQSVDHYIGRYEGIYTPVMLEIQHGGKFTGGTWTIEYEGGKLLYVTANTATETTLNLQYVNIDFSAGAACKVVHQSTGGFMGVTIGELTIPSNVACADIIDVRDYSVVRIGAINFARNGLVKVTGGTDVGNKPRIYIDHADWLNGVSADPLAIIGTRSGAAVVTMGESADLTGATSDPVSWTVNEAGVKTFHSKNTIVESHASGTAYSLTNSAATYDFGTTDPTITLTPAYSVWQITMSQKLKYNGATFAANRTVTTKLRRTNNTAADVSNSTDDQTTTDIVTTKTETFTTINTVLTYTVTASGGDVIVPQGLVSVVPTAGSLDVTKCDIVAVRLA